MPRCKGTSWPTSMNIRTLFFWLGVSTVRTVRASCIDENGKDVDWFVAIKTPYIGTGLAYVYVDANTPRPYQFNYQSNRILCNPGGTDLCSGTLTPKSAIARTTLRAVSAGGDVVNNGYLFYNDGVPTTHQPSISYDSSKAHAKGVVYFNSKGGFWMVHSVPGFSDGPPSINNFIYPTTGMKYGQGFMCISLPVDQMETVAAQLGVMYPQIYSANFPTASNFPNLPTMAALINNQPTSTGTNKISQLTTMQGVKFTHFSKSKSWGKDIYSLLIALYYKAPLVVESWVGSNPIVDGSYTTEPPYYKPTATVTNVSSGKVTTYTIEYDVLNVKSLAIPSSTSSALTYRIGQDHSKWAISLYKSTPVVCMGDINRQNSQFSRGGGSLCIESASLHALFNSIVVDMDQLSASPSGAQNIYPSVDQLNPGATSTSTKSSSTAATTKSTLITAAPTNSPSSQSSGNNGPSENPISNGSAVDEPEAGERNSIVIIAGAAGGCLLLIVAGYVIWSRRRSKSDTKVPEISMNTLSTYNNAYGIQSRSVPPLPPSQAKKVPPTPPKKKFNDHQYY